MRQHLRIFENERVALPVLVRELGVICAIGLVVRVQKSLFDGAPYQSLSPDVSEDERRCREQIGPAIALYQELMRRGLGERAYPIVREIILDAGLKFLTRTLSDNSVADLLAQDNPERMKTVEKLGRSFPNAEIRWERVDQEAAEFTVTHCRFPAICESCGVPELAPVFCEVDEYFFQNNSHNVMLFRETTIAEGGQVCPFKLFWVDDDAPIH